MNNENNVKLEKGLALKIIMPVLLICIVAGIWGIKNEQKKTDHVQAYIPSIIESQTPSVAPVDKLSMDMIDNVDFSLHVTEKIDLDQLKSYGIPVVIDFGSDSCTTCKETNSVLKELNKELKGKAIIKFVDVWKYKELAQGYPVSMIPTQILIDSSGKPYKPKDPESKKMKLYISGITKEHLFTAHQGGITKEQLVEILEEMGMENY